MKKKKERRVYLPRVLGSGQVMMPADLKRLHKYMLEIEHISVISDEEQFWRAKPYPSLARLLRQLQEMLYLRRSSSTNFEDAPEGSPR